MRTALALTALALFTATAGAQDSVTLKWTLTEGTVFYAKNVTDMDMAMSVMNQNIDMKMKTTAVQKFKVLSAKAGATKIEMTLLTMEISADGLPGGIPGLGGLGDRVKGATLTATLNDKFAVSKLEGYDKFIEKIAGDDENVLKQTKQQLSEAAVGQMFSQVFAFAPDKGVKVGDSWTRSEKMPAAGFDATVKQKYKLDSVKDGVAKLALTGDMEFKAGDGIPALPPGVKVDKFDMKAEKFAGTLLFDTKAGRLTENKTDMDMNGEMAISAMGQKIEMTMKIKAKQTTTVTDKSPVKD